MIHFCKCGLQADDILDQVGDTVKSAIKTKYGLENDFTSLWDSTMQQVLYIRVFVVFEVTCMHDVGIH